MSDRRETDWQRQERERREWLQQHPQPMRLTYNYKSPTEAGKCRLTVEGVEPQ